MLQCFFEGKAAPKLYLTAQRRGGEISGNGYERVALDGKLSYKDGAITNPEDVLFPIAAGAWGNVLKLAIVDDDGDVIIEEYVKGDALVTLGKRLRIPAGMITAKLSD